MDLNAGICAHFMLNVRKFFFISWNAVKNITIITPELYNGDSQLMNLRTMLCKKACLIKTNRLNDWNGYLIKYKAKFKYGRSFNLYLIIRVLK